MLTIGYFTTLCRACPVILKIFLENGVSFCLEEIEWGFGKSNLFLMPISLLLQRNRRKKQPQGTASAEEVPWESSWGWGIFAQKGKNASYPRSANQRPAYRTAGLLIMYRACEHPHGRLFFRRWSGLLRLNGLITEVILKESSPTGSPLSGNLFVGRICLPTAESKRLCSKIVEKMKPQKPPRQDAGVHRGGVMKSNAQAEAFAPSYVQRPHPQEESRGTCLARPVPWGCFFPNLSLQKQRKTEKETIDFLKLHPMSPKHKLTKQKPSNHLTLLKKYATIPL